MTEEELIGLVMFDQEPEDVRVTVTASDYAYEGWLSTIVRKRSGAFRAVVEDDNGRLFIHNAGQLSLKEARMNIATERLRMLWLTVFACGGKLRISNGMQDEYPGDSLAVVFSHTDPANGDFILEIRRSKEG